MTPSPADRRPSSRRAWLLCLAGLLLAVLPALAWAQQGPLQQLSDADRAEIAHFTLNADVLARLQNVVAESHRQRLRKSQLDMTRVHSLDDMAAQLVAVDPRIQPLLARNGFTPHRFVVANLALVTTAIAVSMKRQGGNIPDSANTRFYESHEAQIARLLQSASQP